MKNCIEGIIFYRIDYHLNDGRRGSLNIPIHNDSRWWCFNTLNLPLDDYLDDVINFVKQRVGGNKGEWLNDYMDV